MVGDLFSIIAYHIQIYGGSLPIVNPQVFLIIGKKNMFNVQSCFAFFLLLMFSIFFFDLFLKMEKAFTFVKELICSMCSSKLNS